MTAAHDAPPILSAAQEADAEAAFEAWRDGRRSALVHFEEIIALDAWMAAWRACRHATIEEVERQRRDEAKRAKRRANGGQP
jgi:hypothetical protein